eukprot:9235065-Pyramimonas_sp.AAC.1
MRPAPMQMAHGASLGAPSRRRSTRARTTRFPTLRMEHVSTLKPPHLVAARKLFKAYGILGKITVADDR